MQAPTHAERLPMTDDARLSPSAHALRELKKLDDQPAPRFADLCRINAETATQEAIKAAPGYWREFCLSQARFWSRMGSE